MKYIFRDSSAFHCAILPHSYIDSKIFIQCSTRSLLLGEKNLAHIFFW